ncbi:MAG TPA: hypothetical protein DGG95_12855 [Cytophagales bacterium]|jgi:hypothetical protein|nr:hypothetical protein [Cytophagales bacterium]
MKGLYLFSISFAMALFTHAHAQNESAKTNKEESQFLGNKILEEHGLKYYDNYSYRIVVEWIDKNVRPWQISLASIEKSLRETDYHGQKLKLLKNDMSVYSESITAEEIANTVFKNKEGKDLRIKDVGRVERLTRTCTGAVQTPDGLFINSRTKDNKPEVFLFANNSLIEFQSLKNYIVHDYSPVANEILVSKYSTDPFGDSMSHEIFTYNLKSNQLKRQGDLGWIYVSPRYSKDYNTIFVTVNVKSKDGVGSEAKELSLKVIR